MWLCVRQTLTLAVWQEGQLSNAESSMRNTNGWQWVCPDNTPLKDSAIDVVLNDELQPKKKSQGSTKKFVADFYKSTDICHNPQFRELVSGSRAAWGMVLTQPPARLCPQGRADIQQPAVAGCLGLQGGSLDVQQCG